MLFEYLKTHQFHGFWVCLLPRQGYIIVFRFIIELKGFWSLGNSNRSIFIWGFLKDVIFWLVLKLEISYQSYKISWRILVSFRGFFEDYIFARWNILSFHNSSFALRYFFNVNGEARVWHTPCLNIPDSQNHLLVLVLFGKKIKIKEPLVSVISNILKNLQILWKN